MSNYIGRDCHRITQSQNVRGWKGPLWVITSASSNVFAHPEHVGSSVPQRIIWAFGLKGMISCYLFFFPHSNGEDLKLAGETVGMNIPSTEDRRAWNKLPTND